MREETRDEARHAFAEVEGVRLHWTEVRGRASAPPVVLLHGLNDSHLTWAAVAPRIARDRRVLMLDLPGHGLSERPDASYSLAWHGALVGRWLEANGLSRVDLVGHSFGGGVAQWVLLEHRHRVRRLALVAAGGLGRDVAALLRLAAVPGVVERFGQPFMAPGTRLALWLAGRAFSSEQIAAHCAMNAAPGTARAFARTVRDVIGLRGQRRGFFERAHEIGDLPPIAVFWGERDRIIPVAHGEALAHAVDGVVLTRFERCGHYLQHDAPARFADELCRFLDAPEVAAARLRDRAA